MYAYIYVCIPNVNMGIHTHFGTHLPSYLCDYVPLYACQHVNAFVLVHLCVHCYQIEESVFVYSNVDQYVYAYIYIHIYIVKQRMTRKGCRK